MKANRAYHLIVSRGGLLDPKRTDRIEIVEVDTQEVILYWQLPRKEASRLGKRLRKDLAQMEPDEFIAAWGDP